MFNTFLNVLDNGMMCTLMNFTGDTKVGGMLDGVKDRENTLRDSLSWRLKKQADRSTKFSEDKSKILSG